MIERSERTALVAPDADTAALVDAAVEASRILAAVRNGVPSRCTSQRQIDAMSRL